MLATRLADEIPVLADVDRLVTRDVFLEIFAAFVDTDVERSAGISRLFTMVDRLVMRDVFLEMFTEFVLTTVDRLVMRDVFLEMFSAFVLTTVDREFTFEFATDARKWAVEATRLADEIPVLADVDRLVMRDVFLEMFSAFVLTTVDREFTFEFAVDATK